MVECEGCGSLVDYLEIETLEEIQCPKKQCQTLLLVEPLLYCSKNCFDSHSYYELNWKEKILKGKDECTECGQNVFFETSVIITFIYLYQPLDPRSSGENQN